MSYNETSAGADRVEQALATKIALREWRDRLGRWAGNTAIAVSLIPAALVASSETVTLACDTTNMRGSDLGNQVCATNREFQDRAADAAWTVGGPVVREVAEAIYGENPFSPEPGSPFVDQFGRAGAGLRPITPE